MFLIDFAFAAPTISIFARDFTNDFPAKPLHPTSIGSYLIFHDPANIVQLIHGILIFSSHLPMQGVPPIALRAPK